MGMTVWRQLRGGHRQTFDRRQHADGRGDHAVAEQQPGAQHQRPQQSPGPAPLAVVQQAVKREHAALAVILGAQHEDGVFDGDDQGHGPDHQRDAAQDVLGRAGNVVAKKICCMA